MAVIFGTQGRDTLDGTGLDDIIQGWAKDRDALTDLGDELRGFGGDDRLWGRGGKDDLSGGDNRDRLFGGDGRDTLDGGFRDDTLDGGDGPDLLIGWSGDDRLFGGDGRDRFEFSRNYARDTITDFKDDVDTIELNGTTLGVTSKTDALSHATVVNGDTVFTFDTGDVLIVENIADPNLLRDDIAIV